MWVVFFSMFGLCVCMCVCLPTEAATAVLKVTIKLHLLEKAQILTHLVLL